MADYYYGKVSVCAQDTFQTVHGRYFYKWVQLTYDVQGDIYKARATTTGWSDPHQYTDSVEAYDKWNFGSATQVYCNYGTEEVNDSLQPYSMEVGDID